MAKVASVQLNWTPSVTPGVTGQTVTVVVNNGTPVVAPVVPTQTTYGPFDVPENGAVHVAVTAELGTLVSVPATLDFNVGVLTPPAPVTGVGYTVVGTKDV